MANTLENTHFEGFPAEIYDQILDYFDLGTASGFPAPRQADRPSLLSCKQVNRLFRNLANTRIFRSVSFGGRKASDFLQIIDHPINGHSIYGDIKTFKIYLGDTSQFLSSYLVRLLLIRMSERSSLRSLTISGNATFDFWAILKRHSREPTLVHPFISHPFLEVLSFQSSKDIPVRILACLPPRLKKLSFTDCSLAELPTTGHLLKVKPNHLEELTFDTLYSHHQYAFFEALNPPSRLFDTVTIFRVTTLDPNLFSTLCSALTRTTRLNVLEIKIPSYTRLVGREEQARLEYPKQSLNKIKSFRSLKLNLSYDFSRRIGEICKTFFTPDQPFHKGFANLRIDIDLQNEVEVISADRHLTGSKHNREQRKWKVLDTCLAGPLCSSFKTVDIYIFVSLAKRGNTYLMHGREEGSWDHAEEITSFYENCFPKLKDQGRLKLDVDIEFNDEVDSETEVGF